jgi:hypothetical protein
MKIDVVLANENTGGATLVDTAVVAVPSTMTRLPDHAESVEVALELI